MKKLVKWLTHEYKILKNIEKPEPNDHKIMLLLEYLVWVPSISIATALFIIYGPYCITKHYNLCLFVCFCVIIPFDIAVEKNLDI